MVRRRRACGPVAARNPHMNQPSANPYAPPSVDVSQTTATTSTGELRPLWIWLGIAAVTSFFGTPADPISMLIALAFGLVCFCVGAILGSSLNLILRTLPLFLWIAPASWLALSFGGSYFAVGAAVYGLASIGIGVWACRRIQRGRLRIFSCFFAGYVLGSFVGAIGTVAGAVIAANLARRSLRMPDAPGDT